MSTRMECINDSLIEKPCAGLTACLLTGTLGIHKILRTLYRSSTWSWFLPSSMISLQASRDSLDLWNNNEPSSLHSDDGGSLNSNYDLTPHSQLQEGPSRGSRTPNFFSTSKNAEKKKEKSVKFTPPGHWAARAKVILPHVGLILISMAYVIAGATLFYFLERPNEHKMRRFVYILCILFHCFAEAAYSMNLPIMYPIDLYNVRRIGFEQIRSSKVQFLERMWHVAKTMDLNEWTDLGITELENVTEALFYAFEKHYIEPSNLKSDTPPEDQWSFSSCIFFALTVVTTIGYGNPAPQTLAGQIACILFALVGIPLTLVTIADMGKFLGENLIFLYGKWISLKYFLALKLRASYFSEEMDKERACKKCQVEEKLRTLKEERKIPTILVMCILVGYTALGACLICLLEHWDFFSSFYFSFITMTTIGFGDIVTKNDKPYLLLVYIVVGLAIATMCIDLVGVQYIRKIHFFGRKIQKAREALAIVGGKVVYISDALNIRKMSANQRMRYIGVDGFLLENMIQLVPFKPEGVASIGFIDDGATETMIEGHNQADPCKCRYCYGNLLNRDRPWEREDPQPSSHWEDQIRLEYLDHRHD